MVSLSHLKTICRDIEASGEEFSLFTVKRSILKIERGEIPLQHELDDCERAAKFHRERLSLKEIKKPKPKKLAKGYRGMQGVTRRVKEKKKEEKKKHQLEIKKFIDKCPAYKDNGDKIIELPTIGAPMSVSIKGRAYYREEKFSNAQRSIANLAGQ